jgi:hypothetical protein
MRYGPRVVEVPAGTTLTWRFADGPVPHDVRGEGFASATLRDGTFAHTFVAPGTYDYGCTLHPGMTGRVIVVPEGHSAGETWSGATAQYADARTGHSHRYRSEYGNRKEAPGI